ncbi:DNA polymerase III subunit gamma and tau [Saccharopolyspora sp. HNM0986]|uniref:DNA polymerase III subunit gamma and tau n=1 Tax=Saccharopolyspora galaxeae TaxID=2781241 RepID=UPI0019091C3F|nr:DNA polymerase III subunit gamma and tau [Saccharopolyspora sp. HNM0986]MBK0865512.1 DNA polymerase III subunit gamma and tau [Saccharopolyspora sp. HNM0986]
MALALYRKYRPATFAEVVGQEHVTEPLRTALGAQRINHAYLFSGPRGCGKTSSARILARSLNCAQGPTPDPCGECDSCVALAPEGGGSVDVIELDAASHGGVDDTRELRDRAFFAPAQSRYRIFVIDEAHMVTTQGFNALLKIVEEPPEHLIFVFATTEPDKVLTTIRSRTHHYPFRLMPPGVMRELLETICGDEGVRVEPAVYPLVIRAGGGSARDTLSVLDQLLAGAGDEGVTYDRAVALLGVTDVALIDDMVDALAAEDGAAVYGTVDRLVEAGHDPRRFASDLLDRLRDLVLLHAVPDAAQRGLLDTAGDELTKMQSQAEQLGAATLSRFAEIVHTGLQDMRGATAPRLLLELLCARMMLPTVSESEGALLQRIEQVERRMTLGPPAEGAAAEDSRRVYQRPSERQDNAQEAGSEQAGSGPEKQAAQAAAPAAPAGTPDSAGKRPQESSVPRAAPPPEEPVHSDPPEAAVAQPEQAQANQAQPTQDQPSQSQPSQPQSSGFDAVKVRQVWTALLQAVAKRNRPTQALLLNAIVQDFSDGTLVLSMPTSGLVKQFAQQHRIEFVRDAMREVLGPDGEYEVQCVEAGEAGQQASAQQRQSQQRPAPQRQQTQRPEQQRPEQQRPEQQRSGGQPPSEGQNGRRGPNPDQGKQDQRGGTAQASGQRSGGRARSSSDDIPPPPEPPPDDEPPPEEPAPPPPPQPPEEEDEESMIAGSSPASAADAAPKRNREAEAVELFTAELGARRIDD